MKTLLFLYFALLSMFCLGQKNRYNDWFDMNLKGKPKSVKETTIFSLNFMTGQDSEELSGTPLSMALIVDEFYFDSLGLISKQYHKNFLQSNGQWTYYRTEDYTRYQDSIILPCFNQKGQELWREKRYLDKNEFLSRKLIDYDTTIYRRDSFNRIQTSHAYSVNIDNPILTDIENEYDTTHDVRIEKRRDENLIFRNKAAPSVEESISTYDYVYDSQHNWILKVCRGGGEISTITEREIKYE